MPDADATERAALEARLQGGKEDPAAWLKPSEVGKLLNNTPSRTVSNWIDRGVIRVKRHPANRYRTCHPEDVQRLLAKLREEPES